MNAVSRQTAIIWAFATLLMLPALAIGHIISDNSFTNVNWSEGFAQQLFSGHLYPRWLPAMNAGAGSPVFYFYAPLPFYLTAPFHLLVGKRLAVLLGMWLMLGLSGQAFLALAASFVRTRIALIAALAYMAMPYHFLVDVWLRSDLGELGAYIFMPLCLLGALRLAAGPIWTFVLAASLAGLLLSHLPLALLFAPFLTAFCLYAAWQGDSLTVLVRGATAAFLGLGLSASYVVPALLLQHLIHADHWSIYRPGDNLLFVRLGFAFELFLDASALIVAALLAIYLWGLFASAQWRRAAPWIGAAAAAFLLTSPVAYFVWPLLPSIFDKVQFAWRSLALLDIAFCMLLAYTLEEGFWKSKIVFRTALFGVVAIVSLFIVYQGRKGSLPLKGPLLVYEDIEIARHAETLEYLPSCRPFQRGDLSDGSAALIAEHVIKEKPRDEVPVFYYPFIDVRWKGTPLPIACDPKTGFIVVGRHAGDSVIGTHQLAPERWGNWIEAASLGIWLLGVLFVTRKRSAAPAGNEARHETVPKLDY